MDEFTESVAGGVIWGLGFALALGAMRAAGTGMRPALKSTIKGSMTFGEWVRTTVAEGRETVEDVYHEAQAEFESTRRRA
jgi:hypothetical protein